MQHLIAFLSLLILSPYFSKECNSQKPLVPALYVFGDSLSDAGNNNILWWNPLVRANYRPYGVSFPIPTVPPSGRYTDGKTFADIIAEYLRLPYPLAYRARGNNRPVTGYTYASGGCGILRETGGGVGCMSMDEQLEIFEATITNELFPIFRNEIEEYLSNSIFLVWAGSNDYLLNYFAAESPPYNSQEFAQLLIDRLSQHLQKLYELGARKFVVLEVGPLGCLPVYRKNGGHNATWCDENKNINATLFNTLLSPMINGLDLTYPRAQFTVGKIYDLTDDAFTNPGKYGLTDVSNSCCTTSSLTLNISCVMLSTPCSNPHEYMFFDGAHPTEASYNILAPPCISGSDVCVPYNIQQLVKLPTNSANLLSAA